MFKFINWLMRFKEPKYMLGRWCHKSLPKCDESVINKKIDFAISDNDMGRYMKLKSKEYKESEYSVSEYIDYWRNI